MICVQGLGFAALSAERAPPQQDLKKDVRQVQAFLAVLLTDSPAFPA